MSSVSVASIALPLADANHHTFSSDLFARSANNWRRGRKRITYKPKGKESCFGEEDRKMKIACGGRKRAHLAVCLIVIVLMSVVYGVALGDVDVVVLTAVYQT